MEQANAAVQFILSMISSLVPVFIFLSVLRLVLQGTLSASAAGLLLGVVNAVILSIAAPPIPGGGLSCFTLMFLQLGIPLEGIALAAAVLLHIPGAAAANDGRHGKYGIFNADALRSFWSKTA